MKKITIILTILLSMTMIKCGNKNQNQLEERISFIPRQSVDDVVGSLSALYPNEKERISKSVDQLAALWTEKDGDTATFATFCKENFIGDNTEREQAFLKLSRNFEILWGNYHKISVGLAEPLHLDMGPLSKVDQMFGAYDPSSHLDEDFFTNKIAFYTILNFPFYSLKEKNKMGREWSRKDWAYARMGDVFTSRVPAHLLQNVSETTTYADTYISEYNIYMGSLRDNEGNALFSEDLVLISHWGLRDELKTHYGEEGGVKKQEMIYEVMKRIINQDIPEEVINKNEYKWNPFSNVLTKEGKEQQCTPEPNTRYHHLLNNFQAMKSIDAFSPNLPTYIQRRFEGDMQIPQGEVEALFVEFVSSPQVKQVAELIKTRIGRDLQPFDIWYDGFKPRSSIKESDLDAIVAKKYPDVKAFESDMPNILVKLGFEMNKATEISSRIVVDPARGAGHAWGAEMASDVSHLRTRIPATGMNYKGYNIAMHEFGHNTEQTVTLQDVDYYMLHGVPNTASTEAMAFLFQKRDLEVLGIQENNPVKEYLMTLDNFWSTYEIMGVSLVDMKVWKWLYEHPEASKEELREAVLEISIEVWNEYYAPVFGVKDSPILAIYSHMIDAPLYLSAYPVGHIVEFQIEQYLKEKNFAEEIYRILVAGELTPEHWMQNAVGNGLSIQPMLNATNEALKKIK